MPSWLDDILRDFAFVLGEMSPYLLFGFLMAGALSVLISPAWVERNLGGKGFWPVLKASAFGVPLPLCSCSVIPVMTSLRRHGASKGATTAFLLSTPQTGADSILATFSLLGGVYAIYRPLVALLSGVLAGTVVSATGRDDPADAGPPEACHEACCHAGPTKRSRAVRMLQYGFVTLPRDIGLTLLIGIAVAALISALLPRNFFADLVPPGPVQILVLMLAGIPVYICATASIPVAAGLIVAGVSPGAAFALLMTGPATNAATVVTVWKVLGRRACLVYLGTMVLAAFVGGWGLDQFLTAREVRMAMHHEWMPLWVKIASAVVLLAVLVVGVATQRRSRHETHEPSESLAE